MIKQDGKLRLRTNIEIELCHTDDGQRVLSLIKDGECRHINLGKTSSNDLHREIFGFFQVILEQEQRKLAKAINQFLV